MTGDESLAFRREGFRFVSNRCRRLGTDLLETRLLLRRVVCMLGAEAARVFYAPHQRLRDRTVRR